MGRWRFGSPPPISPSPFDKPLPASQNRNSRDSKEAAVKIYGPDAIRNVAMVGHGASGKTTLVDALAFVSGSS